jgi:hypothetical protein
VSLADGPALVHCLDGLDEREQDRLAELVGALRGEPPVVAALERAVFEVVGQPFERPRGTLQGVRVVHAEQSHAGAEKPSPGGGSGPAGWNAPAGAAETLPRS